ncbi:hypothetical protein QUA62_27975 [Microcoleus sp. MON1_C1]|uniref:hypothetical protein n=1 Tax=Microcoleus sp. MON1_C1 TaxID=2818827 RepID=UPI002FD345F2
MTTVPDVRAVAAVQLCEPLQPFDRAKRRTNLAEELLVTDQPKTAGISAICCAEPATDLRKLAKLARPHFFLPLH